MENGLCATPLKPPTLCITRHDGSHPHPCGLQGFRMLAARDGKRAVHNLGEGIHPHNHP